MADSITLRVRRQTGPSATPRWERFALARRDSMTIAAALHTIDAPIAWEDDCEWPACGVCTMVINRRARPACTTRIADVDPKSKGTITLEPLAGFRVIRDLWVDRARMADDAARLLSADDAAPRRPLALAFSRCTRCGACIDACPESRAGRLFVGPAAFAERQAQRLRYDQPSDPAIAALRHPGGIGDCGHAEACVEACPEAIPLDEAIATAARDAAPDWLRKLLSR